ncbi:MAG: hypothetical protein A2167_05385 [Planctomycetes bacterium RBG_13_46_10]|nr:MAG: hypothetical protein A2167_05385 [Planctomycetes bacterium RBG_13_46_10]
MSPFVFLILANFVAPENIGTNVKSILWLLPLTVAITAVYKATKMPAITTASFIKEVLILSGSIIVFIIVIALTLFSLAWLITE